MDLKFLNYLEEFISDDRLKRYNEVLSKRTRFITAAIEDVYHLHNTSAVIRSCDAFGIQDIHVIEERNRRKIDREIALGSQQWVNTHRYHSTEDCIDSLKESGYEIVATMPHDKGSILSDFVIKQRSCFFFGSEKKGLTDTVINKADKFVHIPMVGFTQSLNISVSAAILIQYFSSQIRSSNLNWQLSEIEKNEIKLNWIKHQLKDFPLIKERFYNAI